MTYAKPAFRHPDAKTNDVGCTRRDYEGALYPVCWVRPRLHSAAIIDACYELSIEPIAWPSSPASAVLPRHPLTF